MGSNPKPSRRENDFFDKNLLRANLGDNATLIKDIVDIFIKNCPQMLSDIQQAIEQQDPPEVDFTAHAFKGAASNFAAPAVFEAALRLEEMGKAADLTQVEEAFAELEKLTDQLKAALTAFVNNELSTTP